MRKELAKVLDAFVTEEFSSYAVGMRFRPKIQLYSLLFFGIACLSIIGWFSLGRSIFGWIEDLSLVLVVSLSIYDRLFNYLQVDPDGLRQRHFWHKKEVAWDKVTQVGDYTLWGLPSEYLKVDYARPTAKSGHGRILANPADREKFIEALRRFAPQATFTV